MMSLPPQHIVPILLNQMEKTTLGKISRSRLVARLKQRQLAKHVSLLNEARGASFVAPTSESERMIAEISSLLRTTSLNSVVHPLT